ncbi:tetratricopeptide repeat protein [Wenzhouxiangella marina]|uniref:Uncharacterized protein n=1 Tax=Wenzhouxiangella marina TaxID=1579979 RepID=A0A0K0XTU3_9GAMM|nr:tetratricopeptide repeat protein [Wenzhouxiangella marina]AKS41042.1 hypothetical protein WM2015_661 [Wenzhouxiangella marina]MBB6087920.1 cytochrome c-type biogenesis protein CcmH/NrfG [Wenzhouxiangella marina]
MPIDPQLNDELKQLLGKKNFSEAASRCRRALESSPKDPDLLTMLALSELELGDRASALSHLETAVAADGQHSPSRFQLGRLLIGEDRADQAREHLTQCLIIDPNHAGARTLLARLKAARGQIEDARTGARTALRADPDHVPALVLMAELAMEDGNLEEARNQASRAARLAPGNPAAQMVLANVLERQGHLDFAAQALQNAIQASPDAVAPKRALAELLGRHGQDQQALDILESLIDAHPSRSDLRLMLARSLRRLRRIEPALAEYQWLIDDGQSGPALVVEAAECMAQAGRALEARTLITRESLGDRADARFLLARLDLADGNEDHARRVLLELADGDDARIARHARFLLADLLAEQGRADEAIKRLLQGEDADAEALWKAAGLASQVGDRAQEKACLERLLASAGVPEALRRRAASRLADLLDRAGDYSAAAEHLEQAAWRSAIELAEDAEEIVELALSAAEGSLPKVPVDDGRRAPLIVLGWPGSGREAVIDALAASSAVDALALQDWPARRQILLDALDKLDQGAPDEAAQRLVRRRYARRAGDRGDVASVTLESGVLFAPELIAALRAFPEARLVRVQADADDLEIYWKLSGFADTERMKAAYEQDRAQIDRLLEAWDRPVLELSMADWCAPQLPAIEQLMCGLELEADASQLDAAQRAVETAGLRPAGHAARYAGA